MICVGDVSPRGWFEKIEVRTSSLFYNKEARTWLGEVVCGTLKRANRKFSGVREMLARKEFCYW